MHCKARRVKPFGVREILTIDKYEAELRRKSKPVALFDNKLAQLIDDLLDTLHARPTARGLAAPQVGVLRRVAVIDFGEGARGAGQPRDPGDVRARWSSRKAACRCPASAAARRGRPM